MRYIYTKDEDAIKALEAQGYQLIKKQDNGICIYLNKLNDLSFSNTKVVYSNTLSF